MNIIIIVNKKFIINKSDYRKHIKLEIEIGYRLLKLTGCRSIYKSELKITLSEFK